MRNLSSRHIAYIAVAVVAAVAATVSFEHMRHVALAAGEGWRAWLFPLSVDGMLVASTLAAWQAKRDADRVPGSTIAAMGTGLLISVAVNVLSPYLATSGTPEWLPPAVAAWPPLALALAFEQLLRLRRDTPESVATSAAVPGSELAVSAPTSAELPPTSAELPPASAELPPASAPVPPPEVVPEVAATGDVREEARRLVRNGGQFTGHMLGMRFGRSDRWGRQIIAEVAAEQRGEGLRAVV